MSNVILYIATSQVGFIADKNGGVNWLTQPDETTVEDCGYKDFYDRVEAIVMGSSSYEQILGFGEWLWPSKPTYVFSSRPIDIQRTDVFSAGNKVHDFMRQFQAENWGKNIWLLGDAKLVQSFAEQNLIDEYIITIFPTALSKGISLCIPYEGFDLVETKKYSGGILEGVFQKTYLKKCRNR